METDTIEILPEVPAGAMPLGEGRFGWHRYERVGDRYGTCGLFMPGGVPIPLWLDALPDRGALVAEVLEVHDSPHIGDLFHGFVPGGAEVGDVVSLAPAPGAFYVPDAGDGIAAPALLGHLVGLRPDDGRTTFWLHPPALYRLHEQTVRLYAVPEG